MTDVGYASMITTPYKNKGLGHNDRRWLRFNDNNKQFVICKSQKSYFTWK